MLKEQVAEIILHADIYRRPIPVNCVDKPAQDIVNLFKAEVDKLTVVENEGDIYDANCGQTIACDILPKYMTNPNQQEPCYLEISKMVCEFVDEMVEVQLQHTKKQLLEGLAPIS